MFLNGKLKKKIWFPTKLCYLSSRRIFILVALGIVLLIVTALKKTDYSKQRVVFERVYNNSPLVTDYFVGADHIQYNLDANDVTKDGILHILRLLMQSSYKDLRVDEVNVGQLIESDVANFHIDDNDVYDLLSIKDAVKISVDESKMRSIIEPKIANLTVNDKLINEKLYSNFAHLAFEKTDFKWEYMYDKNPPYTYDSDAVFCSSLYKNDKQAKFAMPVYWFGDNFPDYGYNFLYSIANNSYIDVYVLLVDSQSNQCRHFLSKWYVKRSTNIFVTCLRKETIGFEAAEVLCSNWNCSYADERVIGKLLTQRFSDHPFSWVEFRPLYIHLMEKHISRCYTNIMMADIDAFYSSFDNFPFDYTHKFDIVTVTQDGDIQYLLYVRGQLTIMSRNTRTKLLYMEIPDFRSKEVFLRRMYSIANGITFERKFVHVDEGGLARAMYDNPTISVLHVFGQGWIDSDPNHLFALVYKKDYSHFILEIKRDKVDALASMTRLLPEDTIGTNDLLGSPKVANILRNSDCPDLSWVETRFRQCVRKNDVENAPKYPVLFRPNQQLMKEFGLDFKLGTDKILIAEPRNFMNLKDVTGIRQPLLVHFLWLKYPNFDVDFKPWLPEQGSSNQIKYFYVNGSQPEREVYHMKSIDYDENPFHALYQSGLDF